MKALGHELDARVRGTRRSDEAERKEGGFLALSPLKGIEDSRLGLWLSEQRHEHEERLRSGCPGRGAVQASLPGKWETEHHPGLDRGRARSGIGVAAYAVRRARCT